MAKDAPAVYSNEYETVDPAPPAPENDFPSLERRLMDGALPMFERYRALFKLRNLGGEEAIRIISRAMYEDASPLLRHEAAYVLGQMQGARAIPALVKILEQDPSPMVRHEAAEALGNMWGETDEVVPLLERFSREDPAREVRESCEVALANMAYLKDPAQFD